MLELKNKLKLISLAFIFGCTYSLAFKNITPLALFPLSIVSIYFWYRWIQKIQFKKDLFLFHFFFGLGVSLCSFYWVAHTVRTFGNLTYPLSYLVNFSFGLITCPYLWVGLIWIKWRQKKFPQLYTNFTPLIDAIVFTVFEIITPNQFPTQIGYHWIQIHEYLGLAPVFGYSIYSFISYWLAFTFYHAHKTTFSQFKIAFAKITFLIILNFAILPLTYVKPSLTNTKNDQTLNIRIVQANIGNLLKLSSESGSVRSINEVYQRYKRLSLRPSLYPIDLIVWPETAYPKTVNAEVIKDSPDLAPKLFSVLASQTNAELITGGYDIGWLDTSGNDFQTQFNGVLHFDEKGVFQNVYHKHILIPFGEELPFGPLNRWAGDILRGVSFFSEGSRKPSFFLKDQTGFINLICYEVLNPRFVRNYLNKFYQENNQNPSFMINLTNDSWYGNSAEQEQHLDMAKWRALEFQLPLIRSTNTGISSIIDSNGQESKRLQRRELNTLDQLLKIKPNPKPTLFQRFGYLLIISLFSVIILIEYFMYKKVKS